jgi:multiple sugar transport system ATP-binding protein
MASVTLDNLTKNYGGGAIKAVQNLDLEIADGEFLVLVGPSGCGKSTALRMIAGLEEITDGAVWIGEEFVNDVHPKDRDIAMVFQNYALYPHMSVYNNIAFALQLARVPKDEIDRRVKQAASILELDEYLKRRPGQLSGGQRQRVAMGRAIVRQPSVFLMDEPLSNLDAKLRVQMRAEIAALQHRLGVTTLYVTHDQVEAMTMGDRVALLKEGVLQQVDTPSRIYDVPANMFVAAFIGSPTMNLYQVDLRGANGSIPSIRLGGSTLKLSENVLAQRPGLARYLDKSIVVGIRPEDIRRAEEPGAGEASGRVELLEALGSDMIAHLSIDARAVQVSSSDSLEGIDATEGEGDSARCVARLSARSRIRLGDIVSVVFDRERFHFFDAETGDAIWN